MVIIQRPVMNVNTDCKISPKNQLSHKLPVIKELIAQPPAAPAARTSGSRAGVMPPMAYTGIEEALTASRRKVSPRGQGPACTKSHRYGRQRHTYSQASWLP